MRGNKTFKKVILIILVFVIICAGVFAIYVSQYSKAGEQANIAINQSNVKIFEKYITFGSGQEENGLIFYPGGKVEYSAYAPLMQKLSENGIFCVVTKMPFNLAVFNIDAADEVFNNFEDIKNWYIGGHSLGGSMAAYYAKEHEADLKGLVLLASYSTENLISSDLKVLSVYGSEDNVLNMDKYKKDKELLPANTEEVIIEGGNHAQFGDYGKQKGDGVATVSSEEQLELTAESIIEFLNCDDN